MDRRKLTTIAHADHLFCNPLSSAKVEQLLDLLELSPGSRVLDVGCGKGEMLIRLVEKFFAEGLGIDPNPVFLEEARSKAAARLPAESSLVLREAEASAVPIDPESFDAALCVGSTHAFGGYVETLKALAEAVRPGGFIVVGEGFWRQAPSPDYLEVLGARSGDFSDHAGNVARAAEQGLVLLYASVSNEDDWDHYEGLYCRAVELYAPVDPAEDDVDEMTQYIRRWREAYLRWGRATLGFAIYLFQKPTNSPA